MVQIAAAPDALELVRSDRVHGQEDPVQAALDERCHAGFVQQMAVGLEADPALRGHGPPGAAYEFSQAGVHERLPYAVQDQGPQMGEGRRQRLEDFGGHVAFAGAPGAGVLDAHRTAQVAPGGDFNKQT